MSEVEKLAKFIRETLQAIFIAGGVISLIMLTLAILAALL